MTKQQKNNKQMTKNYQTTKKGQLSTYYYTIMKGYLVLALWFSRIVRNIWSYGFHLGPHILQIKPGWGIQLNIEDTTTPQQSSLLF